MSDVQEGRLRVPDKDIALRLSALVAQAELGDFSSIGENSIALLSYPKWLPYSLQEANGDTMTIIGSPLATRKEKRRKHHSGASEPETSSSESEDLASSPSCEQHDFGNRRSIPSPVPMLPGLLLPCDNCISTTGFNIKELQLQHSKTVMLLHKELKDLKQSNARYLFLKQVSDLEDFGVEYFVVRSNSGPEELFYLGVGPKGVTVTAYEDNTKVNHR